MLDTLLLLAFVVMIPVVAFTIARIAMHRQITDLRKRANAADAALRAAAYALARVTDSIDTLHATAMPNLQTSMTSLVDSVADLSRSHHTAVEMTIRELCPNLPDIEVNAWTDRTMAEAAARLAPLIAAHRIINPAARLPQPTDHT